MSALVVVLSLALASTLAALLSARADLAVERAEADLWRSRALESSAQALVLAEHVAAADPKRRLPPGTRTLPVVVALALLAGCGGAGGAAVAKASYAVVSLAAEVRRYVCARELDGLLGDPRAPLPVPTSPGAPADASLPGAGDASVAAVTDTSEVE